MIHHRVTLSFTEFYKSFKYHVTICVTTHLVFHHDQS